MAEPRWLDEEQGLAWRRLMTVLYQLPARLEEPLQPRGVSFFEYMILAMLSDAPDRSLAMGELARLTNSSPSRLSHAASRLERRGWLQRCAAESDGRVTLATLTDDGHDLLVQVAPAHVASVQDLVFDALDRDDVRDLARICLRVLERVAPDTPPEARPVRTGVEDPGVR